MGLVIRAVLQWPGKRNDSFVAVFDRSLQKTFLIQFDAYGSGIKAGFEFSFLQYSPTKSGKSCGFDKTGTMHKKRI